MSNALSLSKIREGSRPAPLSCRGLGLFPLGELLLSVELLVAKGQQVDASMTLVGPEARVDLLFSLAFRCLGLALGAIVSRAKKRLGILWHRR